LIGLIIPTGQFLAVEVKTPVGRLSKEQKAWLRTINKMGGRALVIRSVEEARQLVESLKVKKAA